MQSVRLTYLDRLRVFGILAVFFFHSNHYFDELGWHVKSPDRFFVPTLVTAYMNYWIMPLFFLLAGAGAAMALRRRSGGTFVRERVMRLIVPFFICAPLLIPPQRYFEALQQRGYNGSFIEFLPSVFSNYWLNTRAMMSPDWFGTAGTHLWFLGTLFLLSVVLLPVLVWFGRDDGRAVIAGLVAPAYGRWWIALPAIPLIAERCFIRPIWPSYDGWGDFVFWGTILLYGAVVALDERVAERAVRARWIALAWTLIVFPAMGLFGSLRDIGHYLDTPDFAWDSLMFHAVWGSVTWAALVALLGFAKRHGDAASERLPALVERTMPLYIVHQTVILTVGYAMLGWQASVFIRYPALLIVSLIASLAAVELIVAVPVLRFAFGMKPRRQATGASPRPSN